MAMVKCREYGEMKSNSAGRCPHCGARRDYGNLGWVLIIAVGVVAFAMIFQCGK